MRTFGLAVLVTACTACTPDEPRTEHGSPPKAFAHSIVALNEEVAREARVGAIRPGGSTGYELTGAGVLVAEWDEGAARETHRDLFERLRVRDGAGLSNHATHVAGTIAGSGAGDPSAQGMAPEARLLSFSHELDLVELVGTAAFVSAANHAYGPALGWHLNPACPDVWSWTGEPGELEDARFGRYDDVAAAIDGIVRNADLLSIWAVGNDGDDGPTTAERHAHFPSCAANFTDEHQTERDRVDETLGGAAVAKNVLTVGGVRDLPRSWNASDIVPLASSSRGPTDDGRIKPELLAAGDDVHSLAATADDAYANESGSSSAAAAVTGIVALLVEQYRSGRGGRDPRASELKALLVQTAEDAGSAGPDYGTGYGLVDAQAAATFVDEDTVAPRLRVDVATGSPNELVTEDVPEGTALRVTLAWLDPPGAARSTPDDRAPVLENDLDLSLVAPGGQAVFHPWTLDVERPEAAAVRDAPNRVDTIEVVDVEAADNRWTGAWTVRVESARPLLRNEPQAYAVAASVPISAPVTPVAGSATRIELEVPPNGSSTLSLPIENIGSGTLDWTATTDSPLVELERASGSAGDELVIRANGANLAADAAGSATITLESNEPGRPRTLGVLVTTACEPDCGARLCGPDPLCGRPCGGCAVDSACTRDGVCAPLGAQCPAADLGSSLGSGVVSGVTTGENRLSASCGGELGPDSGFRWTAPHAGRYVLSTEGSAFDTVLSVRRGGCGGSEIACSDDTTDLSSAVVVELDSGESVTAVVDGFDGDSGPFSLGIHELACPDGELGSRLGGELLPKTHPGRLDRLRASCAAEAAREIALGFTAPADGAYRFDASRSNYEATVAILRDDCSGEELACGADSVEVALFAGAHVIVVVDGALAHEDQFALGITTRAITCGADCAARPNGGLCACDERCVELGDCCVDACGECATCTPDQDCEFGRCIPRRCTGGSCGCDPASGGTGATGCDAGAGGVPGEAGGPSDDGPVPVVVPSGCTCRSAPASAPGALGWLGIALAVCALASRRARI
ncbi:MAG TPA: S8 family serine peptidase [Polyangiaceae bacterium]|nr:S8 family serine peptidase [Polyangiaceae bacterium]